MYHSLSSSASCFFSLYFIVFSSIIGVSSISKTFCFFGRAGPINQLIQPTELCLCLTSGTGISFWAVSTDPLAPETHDSGQQVPCVLDREAILGGTIIKREGIFRKLHSINNSLPFFSACVENKRAFSKNLI